MERMGCFFTTARSIGDLEERVLAAEAPARHPESGEDPAVAPTRKLVTVYGFPERNP